jgi:hypothetical protein
MKYLFILVVCSMLATLAGCKSTPVGKKEVLMPAKEKGLKDSKRIAVISVVDGTRNRNYESLIQSKFESFLTGIKVRGVRRFTIVDRTAINSVMSEQRLASDDTFDASTATQLGNLLGADTLVAASFFVSDINQETFLDTERYCQNNVESGGLMGKLGVTKCEDYGERQVKCYKKAATIEFTPKATSVTSGQIVYSKSYSATSTSSKCPNDKNPLLSNDALISESLKNIFGQIRNDVADYAINLDLELIDDTDGMSKPTEEEFNMAMEFANQDLWDRACTKLNMLASSVQNSPTMMYNLGVCSEITGEPDAAKGYYEQALNYMSSLSSSDKDLIFKAIKRMEGKLNLDDHNKENKNFFDKMKDSVTDLM